MSIINLKIVSSKLTTNGNYANKLVGAGESVKTPFGIVEGGKRTFYLFTDQQNAVDVSADLDLSQFDLIKRDYKFVDKDGEEKVAVLSYLYPKRG